MHALIVEAMKLMLSTPELFQPELQAVYQNFIKGATITIVSPSGATVPLVINRTLELPPGFDEVITSDPPRSVPGPHPKCYVYHIQTEYPPREQEERVRKGYHRIGVSVYGSGETPQDAELMTQLLGSMVLNLVEHNQYAFAQLPGASGASTVTYGENEVSGQKLAANVSPFHLIFVVVMFEQRTITA